jgi:hypothetical protein
LTVAASAAGAALLREQMNITSVLDTSGPVHDAAAVGAHGRFSQIEAAVLAMPTPEHPLVRVLAVVLRVGSTDPRRGYIIQPNVVESARR